MAGFYFWRGLAALGLVSALVVGCSAPVMRDSAAPAAAGREPDEGRDAASPTQINVRYVVLDEAFITPSTPQDDFDSLSPWMTPDGHRWVITTAKKANKLIVFDGNTGARLRAVGSKGSNLGGVDRPNGISVVDGLQGGQAMVLVVERDNHRVQMCSLPDFKPLAAFGTSDLKKPYGLWATANGAGIEVIVSDNYMQAAPGKAGLSLAQLDHRFRRYQLTSMGGAWSAALTQSFGDTSAAGAIRITESLYADAANDRLLLAEEDADVGTRLRVYGLADGQYRERDIGVGQYKSQAEGIALLACSDGSGYWIGTDQYKSRSFFHVFDRKTLGYVGSFSGKVTANTDGIWMDGHGDARFPQGVFYAVHDDQAVAAFDWRHVAQALKLSRCSP